MTTSRPSCHPGRRRINLDMFPGQQAFQQYQDPVPSGLVVPPGDQSPAVGDCGAVVDQEGGDALDGHSVEFVIAVGVGAGLQGEPG